MNIWEVLSYDKYLGLPTFTGRSRKTPFIFIIDSNDRETINMFHGKVGILGGRKVLIKVVAQAIPSYATSEFAFLRMSITLFGLLSIGFVGVTNKKVISFTGLVVPIWVDARNMGVISFRDIEVFNEALLAKQF